MKNFFLNRTMGDRLGEAKASGNLGNTLKVMGRFEEAIICCKRHLEISRELGDKVSLSSPRVLCSYSTFIGFPFDSLNLSEYQCAKSNSW